MMRRRTRPLAVFLLMLWLPALAMFTGRLSGCAADMRGVERTDILAPAPDAGNSAAEAEGVVLF